VRVAVLAVQTPFAAAGAGSTAAVAGRLCRELAERGHATAVLRIPFDARAPETIVDQMLAVRLLRIEGVDRTIALAFPLAQVPHDDRVVWALEPHDAVTAALPATALGRRVRRAVLAAERSSLAEARAIHAPSPGAAERLRAEAGREAGVLAVPVGDEPWDAVVAALTA
jgi:hypothetical protein